MAKPIDLTGSGEARRDLSAQGGKGTGDYRVSRQPTARKDPRGMMETVQGLSLRPRAIAPGFDSVSASIDIGAISLRLIQ